MSQLVAAQEAYKKARNEWAAQVLLSEFLFVGYLLPRLHLLLACRSQLSHLFGGWDVWCGGGLIRFGIES